MLSKAPFFFMLNNKTRLTRILLSLLISFNLLNAPVLAVNVDAQIKLKATINFDEHFISIAQRKDSKAAEQAIKIIENNWHTGLVPMALETISYTWTSPHRPALVELLRKETADAGVFGTQDWYQWLWNNSDFIADPSYHNFKAKFYKSIDSKFEKYFKNREKLTDIRLDEIQWGGVGQDEIPPLRNPTMISAKNATYLDDDNIIFGIEINGDVRAYPKRILAWHELFSDQIGGVDITGVYCTLCGTIIPYKTNIEGKNYRLGTSGFLYRSNKLMYDEGTQSLWSTTRGIPVLGPLVNQGIELEFESVVTSTWGEWKKRHPNTTVLSLSTGHDRDYGEGVAYNHYFGIDALMFRTPFNDNRLKNKREILALRFPAAPNQQLAIDTEYLNKNPLYINRIGAQKFIVLTDSSGANRVYDPKEIKFTEYDGDSTVTDDQGRKWTLDESSLVTKDGETLNRLPYHRAFWFGWRAAFPETKLVK